MLATYRISKTPKNLRDMGVAEYTINYICGGETDWEYERRARLFYDNVYEAVKAGKRYIKKMKNNGFEVMAGSMCVN